MQHDTTSITHCLERTGWCRLPAMSDAEYRGLVSRLGSPWCETAVELRSDVKTYLCRPEPVPFHTDHPDADYMAWRCEEQDASDGSQELIDGFAALDACGHSVREQLRHVHAEVRVRKDGPLSRVPLVRETRLGDRLFFASWISPVEQDTNSIHAFETLKKELDRLAQTQVMRVRLAVGEVLAIDNGRLLHGRRAIEGNSSRRLRRFWITLAPTVVAAART